MKLPLLAALVAVFGCSGALASPASDLFEQAAYYLALNYGGFSSTDPRTLEARFGPELEAACASIASACPYGVAAPVVQRMVSSLGDEHTNLYPAERLAALGGLLTGAAEAPGLTLRPDGVAVLRVPVFASRSGAAVHALVRQAQRAGARAMVVDLRGNPGGLLVECMAAVGAFVGDHARLSDNRLTGQSTFAYRAGTIYSRTGEGHEFSQGGVAEPAHWTGPAAVLVDAASASCAEFFAADFQLARRGPVVGEPTSGVANTATGFLRLLDGSGLQITLSRLLRLDGTPYQSRVVPDFAVKADPTTGRDVALEMALAVLGPG